MKFLSLSFNYLVTVMPKNSFKPLNMLVISEYDNVELVGSMLGIIFTNYKCNINDYCALIRHAQSVQQ